MSLTVDHFSDSVCNLLISTTFCSASAVWVIRIDPSEKCGSLWELITLGLGGLHSATRQPLAKSHLATNLTNMCWMFLQGCDECLDQKTSTCIGFDWQLFLEFVVFKSRTVVAAGCRRQLSTPPLTEFTTLTLSWFILNIDCFFYRHQVCYNSFRLPGYMAYVTKGFPRHCR